MDLKWFLSCVILLCCTNNIHCCTVDSNKLNNALSDIEAKGYEIVTGHVFFDINGQAFGANPNGIYGIYILDFFGVDISPFWYMPGESAIIFHACSPPNVSYFSYRSYLGTDNPFYDPFPIEFASLGDSINQFTLNYTQYSNSSPYDSLFTMVTTGDQITYNDIYDSFKTVNLENTLNADIIPTLNNTLIFGKKPQISDIYTFLYRISIPFDMDAYNKYISANYTIYLVSTSDNIIDKINQLQPRKPWLYPIIKNRISNVNETELYMDNVNQLKQSVVDYFVSKQKMSLIVNTELVSMEGFDGFNCISTNTACLGDNHDAAYYKSNNNNPDYKRKFLTENKLYIVLGINHNTINQTVYSNVGIYKLDPPHTPHIIYGKSNCTDCMLYADIAGITNFADNFQNSAMFFDTNSNIKNIEKMFVIAVARPENCRLYIDQSVPCLGLNQTLIKSEDPFAISARAYLNPNTKTGPSYAQFIPDQVLEFNTK